MTEWQEWLKQKSWLRLSFFLAFTAGLLYLVYYGIANFSQVLNWVLGLLGGLISAFAPLFIGLIIAYLLDPIVSWLDHKLLRKMVGADCQDPIILEKKGRQVRTISILLTVLTVLLLLALLFYGFTVLILGQAPGGGVRQMWQEIMNYFTEYSQKVNNLLAQLPASGLEDKAQELISTVVNWLLDNFSATKAIDFITSLGVTLLNLVLGAVVAIYLLKDQDFFRRLWRKSLHLLLPMDKRARFSDTLHEIDEILSRFIRGQLLDSLIIAILSCSGLAAIQLDFAFFIGCFAGIANVIPYFGPFMGMVPAFAVGLLTGGLPKALTALGILFVIQQLDASVISPRVVGTSMGLHPVFLLVAVTVGGYYFGILGMLLAVPVAAIVKLFLLKRLQTVE